MFEQQRKWKMKQLVPQHYAAAMTDARAEVARYRDNSINLFGVDVLYLGRDQGRAFVVHMLKGYAVRHPLCMMEIVTDARTGWRLADQALRELIVEFKDRGEPLPTYLESDAMDLAAGNHPRFLPGRDGADAYIRDIAITTIIGQLVTRHNLKATGRNRRNKSACEIVAEALGETSMTMSYDAVARIWKKWGRWL